MLGGADPTSRRRTTQIPAPSLASPSHCDHKCPFKGHLVRTRWVPLLGSISFIYRRPFVLFSRNVAGFFPLLTWWVVFFSFSPLFTWFFRPLPGPPAIGFFSATPWTEGHRTATPTAWTREAAVLPFPFPFPRTSSCCGGSWTSSGSAWGHSRTASARREKQPETSVVVVLSLFLIHIYIYK